MAGAVTLCYCCEGGTTPVHRTRRMPLWGARAQKEPGKAERELGGDTLQEHICIDNSDLIIDTFAMCSRHGHAGIQSLKRVGQAELEWYDQRVGGGGSGGHGSSRRQKVDNDLKSQSDALHAAVTTQLETLNALKARVTAQQPLRIR